MKTTSVSHPTKLKLNGTLVKSAEIDSVEILTSTIRTFWGGGETHDKVSRRAKHVNIFCLKKQWQSNLARETGQLISSNDSDAVCRFVILGRMDSY